MRDPSTHADSHALQNFRRSQRHLHHRALWPHQLASLPAASGRLRPANSPVSLDQLWVRFFKSFCFLPSHSTGRVVRSGKECAWSHLLCSLSLQEAPRTRSTSGGETLEDRGSDPLFWWMRGAPACTSASGSPHRRRGEELAPRSAARWQGSRPRSQTLRAKSHNSRCFLKMKPRLTSAAHSAIFTINT